MLYWILILATVGVIMFTFTPQVCNDTPDRIDDKVFISRFYVEIPFDGRLFIAFIWDFPLTQTTRERGSTNLHLRKLGTGSQ